MTLRDVHRFVSHLALLPRLAAVGAHGDRLIPVNPSSIVTSGRVRLDVRQHALAEGELAAGRRATGFVYFTEPDAEALELRIDLINASSRERFGEIDIAFALD